jgi:hypothetical protein
VCYYDATADAAFAVFNALDASAKGVLLPFFTGLFFIVAWAELARE